MAKAAVKALEFGPDAIDINMGCPAPKIAGNGGGSALMKSPDLAEKIVEAVVKAVDLPVTVKMRIGWDTENINCVDLAKRCENAGASALTVHGRTKVQMYAPPVYPEYIRAVAEAVNIDVIANGDVTDGLTAQKLMQATGCKAVMVGRGALGRPWAFEQINAYIQRGEIIPEPSVEKRMEVMLRHIELLCEYKGEKVGMLEARKHAAWYMKGIRGAAALRREICELTVIDDIKRIAEKVIATAE